MRFAAIADIHGNLPALDAVLADIRARGIIDIVNLGDCLSGPLLAAATADRLMPLYLPTVAGNHERNLLTVPRAQMIPTDSHAFDQLLQHQLDWIATFPKTLIYQDRVFLCHGTPSDDDTNWLELVNPDGAVALMPLDRITAQAGAIDAEVLLCGHTHFARVVQLGDGRLVVNPGSVGLPAFSYDVPVLHVVQSGSPHARYAILERQDGDWNVALHQVAYDHMAMARLAQKNNRPTWASALASGWIKA